MAAKNIPVVNSSNLYMDGLEYSYTDNSNLTINPGKCRDSSNTIDIVINNPLNLNIDTKGLGGLDTGSVVINTCYGVCVIADSSGNQVPSVLFFNQYTQLEPILPANYDSWRLIGYVNTNISPRFISFSLFGNSNNRYLKFTAPQSINSSGAITSTAQFFSAAAILPNVKFQIVDLALTFTGQLVGQRGLLSTFELNQFKYNLHCLVPMIPVSVTKSVLVSNDAKNEGDTPEIGIFASATSASNIFVINAEGYRFYV